MSGINSSFRGNLTSQAVNNTPADINIFPVTAGIDNLSQYIYDGQSILMINSTLSPNSNQVKAQYFNPVGGAPGSSGPLGFADWNFDLVPHSYLNGNMTASSLLSEQTTIYNNLQPFSSTEAGYELTSLGQYELDIVNGGLLTLAGSSNLTLFFSLTSQPYVSQAGKFVGGTPTINNVNPSYSTSNSDNFIFTSNYYTQQKNQIIIIQLVFTVSNTNALNVLGTNTAGLPTVSVLVYNKYISQESLASLSNGSNPAVKVLTAGPFPLQYMQNGSQFNASTPCYNANNNIPLIIDTENYQQLYAVLPVIYVPPRVNDGSNYGQYLNAGSDSLPGYIINNNLPSIPANTSVNPAYPICTTLVTSSSGVTPDPTPVNYGHFVIGIAYSTDFSIYNPGSSIISNILIKNIWRSPISIYSSYNAFSVNDMATKLVVLLFGKVAGGGSFLVTNTGTPINAITNYGITSLRNFMNIMTAILDTYTPGIALVDYFINPNLVQTLRLTYQVITLQPLLKGNISNPPSVLTYPNMYFLLLNTVNSANMSIDPTTQLVIGQPNYGFNGRLCATGFANYYNSNLQFLSTTTSSVLVPSNNYLFANSIYLGLNKINGVSYYTLIILPEALFNGVPIDSSANNFSVYSTANSLFYLSAMNNSSSQFSPNSYTISNSVPTTNTNKVTTTVSPNYRINKIVLSVSNTPLL